MEGPETAPSIPARFLIVEDEAIVALFLQAQLLKIGHQVTAMCMTGEAALRSAHEQPPDAVLMDIRIQGEIDGIETARRLQNDYDVPIIFITANSDTRTIERARQTGPFGYLVKPLHPAVLTSTVGIALQRCRAERDLRHASNWLSSIIGNMAGGVIVTDGSGCVHFMNAAAESLTGWRLAAARNRAFHTVLPLRDLETQTEIDDLVAYAILNRRPVAIPAGLHAVTLSGSFAVEGEISPRPEGIDRGCIVTFRDVSARLTEEKETEALLVPRQFSLLIN